MSDKFGIAEAAKHGITLGQVGQRIVLENEHVRVWEINLDPGETIDFHIHYHPYLVISLGGGENEIETIFGNRIKTVEELGSTVFINEMRAVHRLTNRAKIPYLSRLVELKNVRWTTEAKS
jgi:quercetin dioxygenase-like cupin family protein